MCFFCVLFGEARATKSQQFETVIFALVASDRQVGNEPFTPRQSTCGTITELTGDDLKQCLANCNLRAHTVAEKNLLACR